MLVKERSIKLMWRLNPTVFQLLNKESMSELTRRLGSGIKSVNYLCSRTDEMKLLLPTVIGVSSDNQSVNWQGKVSSFWHNFGLEVAETGMTFDISYKFDINDNTYKSNIEQVLSALKVDNKLSNASKEKALVEYLFSNDSNGEPVVSEEDLYKYGIPVNIEDYLNYRYCLLSSQVANKPEYVTKSNRIRFYLHNEEESRKSIKEVTRKATKAITSFTELIGKPNSNEIIDAMCIVYKLVDWSEFRIADIEDRQGYVLRFANERPSEFLEALKNVNLIAQSKIQSYINVSLLRNLSNSSIIVDGVNNTKVLGDNMDGAVTYLSAELNAPYANELEIKFKGIK